jgi:hypothetical protein
MASQPVTEPEHKPQAGSPFCSDPKCLYCTDLRKMQEQIRKDNGSKTSRVDNASSAL